MMRSLLRDACFLGGAGLAVAGVAQMYEPLAWVVAGLLLAGAGWVLFSPRGA